MKLQNKKTGEIGYLIADRGGDYYVVDKHGYNNCGNKYSTLAELNEEWEDVPEEPKEYWYVSAYGNLAKTDVMTDLHREAEEIGNLFETKEEAEKAVEKLKAWKRLKDKGFSIYSWDYEFDMVDKPAQTIILRASAVNSSNTDLDLLFGGEE